MEGVHNGIGETYHLPLFFQNYLLKLGVKLVTCDLSAKNQNLLFTSNLVVILEIGSVDYYQTQNIDRSYRDKSELRFFPVSVLY